MGIHVVYAYFSWANWVATVIVSSTAFEVASIIVILVNSILLALEDPMLDTQSDTLELFGTIFLYLYTFEFLVKVLSLGFVMERGSYLRDPWNILDFSIVVSGYLPLVMSQEGGGSINLSGLRSLRVLRPLRTITAIRSLRSLILTIFVAIPYLLEIMVVLVFVFLIFAIAGLQLFSGLLQNSCYDAQTSRPYVDQYGNSAVLCTKNSCPVIPGQELICGKNSQNPDFGTSSFDDLPSSFLMVYVVTTLEGWTQIMYYVQETFNYWLSLYFLLVVFIAAFFLINLTLAVITIKFNESQDESKVEELARAKHENDDFFKILPLPAFPRVKNTFKEGISLTRMRANKDFDLLKITKYDTIIRPFKEVADPTVTVQAYKEIKQRSRVEMRKYEVQTFDNTHDWRKMKGDLFTGDVMKKAIQIYTPTTKVIENEWLKRSATNVAKPAHKNQIVPIHSSSRENLKQSLPKLTSSEQLPQEDGPESTYHTLANFVPVANLRGFDLEDAKSEVEIHLQELVNMTTMNSSELTRYCNTLAKKQAQEKLKAAASIDMMGDKSSPTKGGLPTIKPAPETAESSPKKTKPQAQGQRFLDSIQENDFGLSDDEEDKQNIPKDVKKLTALIMANNKVRLYLRRFVRRWKKNHYHRKERAYDTFNDLRQDEDFMNVGGVKLMGAIKEKPKAPVAANPVKKTPEITKKAGTTPVAGQQADSQGKEVAGAEAGKAAEKPNTDAAIADQLAKADNAAAAAKKAAAGDAKDPTKPVDGDKPDGEQSSKPKDEYNLDEKSLLNNEAFQGLVDVLKNEGLKRFDDTAKKEAKKQKKKKKADNDDEEGQKKQNPEWIEEEALLKYYQGKNYQNLKLEAAYKYNIIPSPAFSSIFDILPDHTRAAKHRVMMEMESGKGKGKKAAAIQQAGDKLAPKLEIEYTMVELKQAANKKKKKKPSQAVKNTSSAGGLDSSSKLQSSSGMSDESGDLSAYSSDDQGNHNRIMSEIKEKRIRWLETNEKYIIQKPFPLLTSQRKDRIFSHMSYDPYMAKGMAASSLTGMSSATSGSKRDKNKGVDYGDEFETVNEMFKTDQTNDKKDLKEYKVAENKPDYTVLYQKVQAMDSVEGKIVRFNWSGNQVVATRQFTLSQTFKTLDSLNKRVLEIWMQNYSGLWATIRRYFRETVENSSVNLLLMVCVFLNTLMMASDGLTPDSWAPTFSVLNYVFVSIFAMESFLKIIGYPFNVFAKDAFNVFDAIVVCISFVEVGINASSSGESSGGNAASAFRAVRIFRIFRVLRVTRLLRSLRFMKVIIEVIKGTLEQFAYIAVLLFLFIFIFTLLGTQVFGGQFKFMKPTDRMRFNWDTFQNGFYTTFDVLTMENWNNVLVNVLRSETNAIISLIYLLAWIFIGNYIFLNLFLAILLDGFESSDALTMVEELDTEAKELTATYQRLVKEIKEKARNEENSSRQANKQLMMIIEPDKHRDAAAIRKNQACYLIVRDDGEDNESLEEALDIEKRVETKFKTKNIKEDPYKDVDCIRSLYFLEKTNPFRKLCAIIVSHPAFENFILTLIILGSFKLVVETYIDLEAGSVTASVFNWIDNFFTVAFIFEMCVKIIRNGFFVANTSYLRDSWSILDFIIVITSIIDLAVEGVDLPFLRVLRLLRTLRPLRVISKNQSMKIVVNALVESLVAILNVLIVILMVWIMFAILGMNMMKDKLGYCNLPSDPKFDYYGVTKDMCLNMYGGQWLIWDWNYDNIINSLISLFVLSTLESWPDQLASVLDANDDTIGPIYMDSPYNGIFFVVFILVGSLFLMNLFIGVIFVQFSEEQKKEKESKYYMVTDDQMRWIMVQDMIATSEPTFDILIRPKGRIRLLIFKLINSKSFEMAIMGCIILNIVAMGMVYETMSEEYSNILNYVNLGFSIIFIIECALKIAALDLQYFKFAWNLFDFTIVFLSILDIVLDNLGGSIGFLKAAPQYARVLRVLRVSRLFKLMKAKQLEGINKIIKTLIFSFPTLMNVMLLLFLIYFISAVLAVFLFKGAPADPMYNNDVFNFNDFHHAFMTLFRCSTGENWPTFMYYYANQPGSEIVGRIFFLFYMFMTNMVMLKVFQLVVMQQFEEFYFNPENPLNSFDDLSETFRVTWNQFTIKTRGTKIKASRLTEFFYYLE